jgi:hypothetical protein
MKIEHLLEMPVKQRPAAAQALKQRRVDRAQPKPAPVVGQGVIPNVTNPAVSQATTNPQPTTLGAPAAVQAKQAPAGPAAGSLAGWQQGPTATAQADELAAMQKNAGLPVTQEPQKLQATPAEEPAGAPAAPKKSFMQKASDAAQSVSNVIQRGAANAKQNIPAITDYAGDLAQGVAPGINRTTDAAGDVVQGTGSALQKGLKGVASVAGGLGDVGSEITGGLSKMVGAAKGGYNHGRDKYYAQGTLSDKAKDAAGWKDAARQNFADPRQSGQTPAQQSSSSSSAPVQNTGYSGGGDEVSQLKARLDKIEQRLGGAA